MKKSAVPGFTLQPMLCGTVASEYYKAENTVATLPHSYNTIQYPAIQYNTIQYNFSVRVGKFIWQQKNTTNIKTSQHCILYIYCITKNWKQFQSISQTHTQTHTHDMWGNQAYSWTCIWSPCSTKSLLQRGIILMCPHLYVSPSRCVPIPIF